MPQNLIGGYMMNHQGIELNELISQVKIELKKVHYSDLHIGGFVTVWNLGK